MLTTIYLEGDRCWRRAEGCEGSARCRWSYESKFVSTSAAVSSGSFPFKRNAILYFFYQNKVFCVLRVNILQNKWKINCFLKFCPFLKGFIFGALKRNSCSRPWVLSVLRETTQLYFRSLWRLRDTCFMKISYTVHIQYTMYYTHLISINIKLGIQKIQKYFI